MTVAVSLLMADGMREPSPTRQRTLALHRRVIAFSTHVNKCYPRAEMDYPSEIVWKQLVRAADSVSSNLVEAGNGSSDADFLNKMRLTLREAREAHACLQKIQMGALANAQHISELQLQDEADQLCAIFTAIIRNMSLRLADERQERLKGRKGL